MILRRVIAHFRKQEWTAIALDFLIVVIGVFVGLQVSNWNAANAERATERQLLSQVQSDVEAAVTLKTEWLVEMEAHRKSLIDAVDVIQNKPEQQTISDAACRSMWSSHLLFYPVAPLGSLDEILSRGSLHTSQGQALRPALLTYRDHHEVIRQLNTTLTGLANLGDTYGNAFPRRVIDVRVIESTVNDPANEQVARITDSTFHTTCLLDIIRADQMIQNKLLSNLARTDGVLQRVRIELSALEKIRSDLMQAQS
ncbi:hypothetical protein [Hyphococcus sp.]|uniref:hypothetical protein n=1 Tax=Hyphococcus sp. TaxID=2038636 RepID=UPI0020819735|nr:MAG: hypothetical protein DHS20C04_24100 [Marinicaulis sp.]